MLAKREEEEKKRKHQELKEIKIKKQSSYSETLVSRIIWLGWLTIWANIIFNFINPDNTDWSQIIIGVSALMISSVGFHIWKARGENLIKIKNNPNYDQERLIEEAWDVFQEASEDSFKNEVRNDFDN